MPDISNKTEDMASRWACAARNCESYSSIYLGLRDSEVPDILLNRSISFNDPIICFYLLLLSTFIPSTHDEMTNSSTMSRCFHTAEEWESQRQNFKRLYLTEDKPLGNVADAMYKIYGFQATYVITFRKPTRLFLLLEFKMSLCSIRFLDPNFTLYHDRWHVISTNI